MADKILIRRDNEENWIAANPKLAEGEICLCVDKNYLKIGDGHNRWSQITKHGYDGTIAQELGGSANSVVSQKVITELLNELETTIATETENREQAEEELRGDLSEFALAITENINNNRTAIQNEVTRATEAEEELQTRTAHIAQLASVDEADNINIKYFSTIYIVDNGKAVLISNNNGTGIGQMKQTLIEDGKVLFRENIKVGAATMDATYWSEWRENIDTTPIIVDADGVIDIESGSSFIVPFGVQSISFVQPPSTNYHKKITLVCTGDVMFPVGSVMRGSTNFGSYVTISYQSLSGRGVNSSEYPITLTVDCICVDGTWKYIVS